MINQWLVESYSRFFESEQKKPQVFICKSVKKCSAFILDMFIRRTSSTRDQPNSVF